jgi:4-hydroxy-3-methylbut-2-enyl diphosphate reductase
MEIVTAEAYGMCFGVRDALALALNDPHPETITVIGELVHNPDVLRALDTAGLQRVPSPSEPVATPRVMITAHGAAPSVHAKLRAAGLEVLDATCPLVTHAHRMLDRLVGVGFFRVILGTPGQVVVLGLRLYLAV